MITSRSKITTVSVPSGEFEHQTLRWAESLPEAGSMRHRSERERKLLADRQEILGQLHAMEQTIVEHRKDTEALARTNWSENEIERAKRDASGE